jgi:hypothetical protein
MAGWPISFSPNTKPGVKWKQENVATKADKRKYEDKRDRCFQEHFTPGLVFGEKDIGHPAITEYLSLTGQGKLQNRKIISERKQTFYGNSLPVRRTVALPLLLIDLYLHDHQNVFSKELNFIMTISNIFDKCIFQNSHIFVYDV